MSHEPPLPDAARSPYPLREPPHPQPPAAASRTSPAGDVSEDYAEQERRNEDGSLADWARDGYDRLKESRYGLGAAIGIGSAALLAALLLARRGSKANQAAAGRPRRQAKADS